VEARKVHEERSTVWWTKDKEASWDWESDLAKQMDKTHGVGKCNGSSSVPDETLNVFPRLNPVLIVGCSRECTDLYLRRLYSNGK